ncbi:MAG TPA: M48 family metalloprotease [Thermoanaerobaculia bacterium]|nr:M48 family metalloprotease [Thermoanaerobaculia bacterium]
MHKLVAVAIALSMAASAEAQLGDILKKIDPSKIKKGANVVRQASRDFTEDEEADIGRVVAAKILATYPLTKNDKLQQYVTLVGNTVAAYSARPELEWHFAVIDAAFVNAFSAPGGFIFVTSAALDQMHSEAELAAVLGHEIAHVTQKHILKEIKRANTINAGVEMAKETSGGSFLNDEMGARVSKIAYEKLFTTGLSRRDEEEADTIGTEIAASAGYKATEFLTFLEGLAKIEGSSQMRMLVSTHPTPEDRIQYLRPKLQSDSGVILAERWEEWTKG